MNEPPLEPPRDPPPFGPAVVRQCIKAHVPIQNHDGLHEVFILTPVCNTVESLLDQGYGLNNNNFIGGTDGEDRMSVDESVSDFSDSSSSDESHESSSNSSDDEKEDDGIQSNGNNNGTQLKQQQSQDTSPSSPMKAFWLRKEMCKNKHGIFTSYIWYAKLLHKQDLYWVTSNEEFAIKAVLWRDVQQSRGRLAEDFVKEIAAMQYLSEWQSTQMPGKTTRETHVMIPDTVMYNQTHLYIVMPYCKGGDLCMLVADEKEECFTEDIAKYYFKQILKGLETLQRAQICHKDLSPENFMILDETCLVIDFGMSLRIPYSPSGRRHSITPQIRCGKKPHMAPEIWQMSPFDGHSVDLWAAATILLFMLTGARLERVPDIDRFFDNYDLGLSDEVTDLLSRMFRLDPYDRLTLEEIRKHPFLR